MSETCISCTALCAGQAGADAQRAGPNAKQQGAMLQRSKWTAQVGLVLHSTVPSPLTGYVLPQGTVLVKTTSLQGTLLVYGASSSSADLDAAGTYRRAALINDSHAEISTGISIEMSASTHS